MAESAPAASTQTAAAPAPAAAPVTGSGTGSGGGGSGMSHNNFSHLRGRQEGLDGITHQVPTAPDWRAPHVVRLRGLPFVAKDADVRTFFADTKIDGVYFVIDSKQRVSGDAFISFATAADAARAMGYNKRLMGRRYIETFLSTEKEMRETLAKGLPPPYARNENSSGGGGGRGRGDDRGSSGSGRRYEDDRRGSSRYDDRDRRRSRSRSRSRSPYRGRGGDGRGSGGRDYDRYRSPPRRYGSRERDYGRSDRDRSPPRRDDRDRYRRRSRSPPMRKADPLDSTTVLKMMGIPFQSTEADIIKWFHDGGVSPVRIHRKQAGGEAFVEFPTSADVATAMKRNRMHMGTRYIELTRIAYEEMCAIVGIKPVPQPPQTAAAMPPTAAGGGGNGGAAAAALNPAQLMQAQQLYYQQQQAAFIQQQMAAAAAGGAAASGAGGGGGMAPSNMTTAQLQHQLQQIQLQQQLLQQTMAAAAAGANPYATAAAAAPLPTPTAAAGGGAPRYGATKMRIQSLSARTTTRDLIELFRGYDIDESSAEIVFDQYNRPTGAGLITFRTPAGAQLALAHKQHASLHETFIKLNID